MDSYNHHPVIYCVVSSIFLDCTYIKSQSTKDPTEIHDYNSSVFKIQYRNGIKRTSFGNHPKTINMTSLAKIIKKKSMQK